MYSIYHYGRMIHDGVRRRAYTKALQRVVTPGSIVLDLGAGTGYFSFVACRLGAKHVYAVEPGDSILLAEEIARANRLHDRITFMQSESQKLDLPDPADVIVFDMRGVLPLFGNQFQVIADARRRFLSPGGVLIPRQDHLWVAPVEASKLHAGHVDPWNALPGVDMTAGLRHSCNTEHQIRLEAEALIAQPQCWATVQYGTEMPIIEGCASWVMKTYRVAHGVALWFDTELVPGVGFSSGPGVRKAVSYGQLFLPFSEELRMPARTRLEVQLKAVFAGEDYVWYWKTSVAGRSFQSELVQSSFFGQPISRTAAAKSANYYVPQLSREAEIDCFTLTSMDGRATVQQIAERLHEHFPERFRDLRQALTRVGLLSHKSSR